MGEDQDQGRNRVVFASLTRCDLWRRCTKRGDELRVTVQDARVLVQFCAASRYVTSTRV